MAIAVTSANTNRISEGARVVVRNSSGTPYIIVEDTNDGGIEVWKGNSTTPTSFSEQDSSNNPQNSLYRAPSAAIDSSDIIHIAYFSADTKNSQIRYVTFNADGTTDTFSGDVSIGTVSEPTSFGTAIAVDSNDIPHIVYISAEKNMGTPYDTIYYNNRIGGSWNVSGVEVEGFTASVGCASPDIAVNNGNIPVISYLNSTDSDIARATGNVNDATSFTLLDLDATALSTSGSSIAVDSDGTVWVAYEDSDNSIAVYEDTTQRDTGSTGTKPTLVADGTDIYVLYEDTADNDIKYDKWTGSWLGETSLETGTYNTAKARGATYAANRSPTTALNTPADSGVVIDSYSETNQNNTYSVASDFRPINGQSFTGNGNTLGSVKFYMNKNNSPTGTIYAAIYAHTGTFGSTGTPTGSELAASATIDASTLTGTLALIEFTFSGANQITLTNGTKYFVVLNSESAGGGSNYVRLGVDDSSPSHGGNQAYYSGGSWTALSGSDVCFYVNDIITGISTTPTLEFTGTDPDNTIDYVFTDETASPDIFWGTLSKTADDVEYNVQVDTVNTFDSSGSVTDSYSESNQDSFTSFSDITSPVQHYLGQSFNGDGSTLQTAKAYLYPSSYSGYDGGVFTAYIYAHTGTYGSGGTPTGSVLATSDTVNHDDLTENTYQLVEFAFSGAEQITLTNGTKYFLVIYFDKVTAGNGNRWGEDNSSPTHGGNGVAGDATPSWTASSNDFCFYINDLSAPLIDADSSVPDAGFANVDTPADTHPFNSGDKADYDVQSGDELDNSTTYYWRVRAKDPSGTDVWGDWATTRSFTTESGAVNHTIVSQDATLALSEDNTTITQNHIIASQDATLALSTDNTTLTQNHVIVAQDITLGLLEDNTTVDQTHIVQPQDILLDLVEDNSVLYQDHVIVSQDATLALSTDNTTIAQNHIIVSQDILLSLTEDNTTLTQNHVIASDDITLASSTDNTTVDVNHIVETQDSTLALSTDNTTLTQNHIIASSDITLGLLEDNTTIDRNHVIESLDSTLALSTDNTTIDQTHLIVPQDATLALLEDATTITQNHIIASNDITLALLEDATTIEQNHIIASNDITLALSEDNAVVDLEGDNYTILSEDSTLALSTDNTTLVENVVIPSIDTTLALSTDNTTITQNHIIVAQDITFTLLADNTTIEQGHVIAPDDSTLALSTDNTSITQNHVIASQDLTLALLEDNTTIEQNHIIDSQDLTLALLTDNASIDVNIPILPDDITIALSTDTTTITQVHDLTVQDITLATSEDATTITQNHIIAPDDITLGLLEDNTTISQGHVVSPADITLSLSEDNTTVDVNHIIEVQDITFALTEDVGTITQNHVIASADITLALLTDNTTVSEQDIEISPKGITFGSTLPRIMYDDSGKVYYRLDNNILISI